MVICTGVIIYATTRDTFEQWIDNYFQHRVVFLNKLPNPDYYGENFRENFEDFSEKIPGRLGGALYESFIMKLGKTKSDKRREFLEYVFKFLFNEGTILSS